MREANKKFLSVFLLFFVFFIHLSAEAAVEPPPGYVLEAVHTYKEKGYKRLHRDYKVTDDGLYVFSKEGNPQDAVIVIQGAIPRFFIAGGMEDDFKKATQNRKKILVVVNSPGGAGYSASEMAKHIRRIGNVTTYVPSRGVADSAGLVVFLAGRNRLIGEGARLGVHASPERDRNQHVQQGEWIQFGLPRGLANSILEEGFFRPGSDVRRLEPDEIHDYQIAEVYPLNSIENMQPFAPVEAACELRFK